MTPFARALADDIAANGPMPLDRWMARCNAHYYASADPLGRDFTTAPEVGQVFGELIGLWAADLWMRAGAPARVAFAELGPGRGTLMADALRATARVTGFVPEVHLVETSATLRAEQAARVAHAMWHDTVHTLPADTPMIVIANEFLDALPIVQSVLTADGWRERAVDFGPEGFTFIETTPTLIHETCPTARAAVAALAARLASQGGAALFVDYGHTAPMSGDTLQAVRAGHKVPPLARPGEADLTAHVDFAAIASDAQPHTRVHGPVAQARFLARLGIAERTHALARLNPAHAAALHAAAARLTAPAQMGALFQVLAITHPDWPTPAGFDA